MRFEITLKKKSKNVPLLNYVAGILSDCQHMDNLDEINYSLNYAKQIIFFINHGEDYLDETEIDKVQFLKELKPYL